MSNIAAQHGAAMLLMVMTLACADQPVSPETGEMTGGAARANVTPSANNSSAIQRIVDTFDSAWTAGDYVTYAAQYTGAEWVGPDGAIETDPAKLVETYKFVIAGLLPGTTRQSIVRRLTFLTGTVAVLDIDVRVTGPIPPFITPWQPGIIRALEKNILLKRGNEWRIVQHQQLLVAPGVP